MYKILLTIATLHLFCACAKEEDSPKIRSLYDKYWQYTKLVEIRTDSTTIDMDLSYNVTLWNFTTYYNTLEVDKWKEDVEKFTQSFCEYRRHADTVEIDFVVPIVTTIKELTDTSLILYCDPGLNRSKYRYHFHK